MPVDTSNFGRIERELEQAVYLNPQGLEAIIKKAAVPMYQKMAMTSAFQDRSGKLRGAIKASAPKWKGSRLQIKIGARGNRAPHAHLVEFGHGGPHPAPAHPFVIPSYQETKDECYGIIKSELAAFIDK